MESNNIISIVIAEEHELFRQGLRMILKNQINFEILGEAKNEVQAIEIVGNLKPDVVLYGMLQPGPNDIQYILTIKQKSPGTRMLILGDFKDETTILKTLKAGAKGYLSKNSTIPSLIKAIHTVYRDELWVERKFVARYFSGEISSALDQESQQLEKKNAFTEREQDVINLLVKGSTNKEIAQNLFISEKTVKSHLNKIFKKLNVSRRLEAILYAIKLGLA